MENNKELIDAMNKLSKALEEFNTLFNGAGYNSDPFSKFSRAVEDLKILQNK